MENEYLELDGEDEMDIQPHREALDSVSVFDEPAIFVNWLNVQAFGDDTVRVTFAETASVDYQACRGSFRMTLDKAQELSEALNNMVALAVKQRAVQAEARRKMN